VVRVRPDLTAVDRAFDYLLPGAAQPVEVGTIVRVPLHGRRVRGWVVGVDVEPETDRARLLEILKVVGAGPPAAVMDLARWTAHRWAGSDVSLYGAASPPNAVREPTPAVAAPVPPGHGLRVVAWPPATDRRELVDAAIAPDGSTIVVVPDATRLMSLVRHLERSGRRVHVLHSSRPDAERTRAWALDEADEALAEAVRVLRVSGVLGYAVYGELQRARAALARGDAAGAVALAEAVEQESLGQGQRETAVEASLVRAQALTQQGSAADSLELLARINGEGVESAHLLPRLRLERARALVRLDRDAEAREDIDEGLRLAREYRLVYDEVGLLRLAAEVAGRSGDRPTEEAREAEAAAILRRIGVPAA